MRLANPFDYFLFNLIFLPSLNLKQKLLSEQTKKKMKLKFMERKREKIARENLESSCVVSKEKYV